MNVHVRHMPGLMVIVYPEDMTPAQAIGRVYTAGPNPELVRLLEEIRMMRLHGAAHIPAVLEAAEKVRV